MIVWFLLAQSAIEWYERANALFEQRKLADAESAVERALATDPKLVSALTLKAKLAIAANKLDEAQSALEAAMSADPKQSYPRFLLGFLFYLRNDFVRARDVLAQADAKDPRVTFYQAMTEEALGNIEAAKLLYEDTLRRDSAAEPRVAYGRLLLTQGNLDRAEKLIDEALKTAPHSRDALYEKGRCLFERGEFSKAAELGERALVEPGPGTMERQIRHLLVRCYLKTGNTAKAEEHRKIFEKLPMTLVR